MKNKTQITVDLSLLSLYLSSKNRLCWCRCLAGGMESCLALVGGSPSLDLSFPAFKTAGRVVHLSYHSGAFGQGQVRMQGQRPVVADVPALGGESGQEAGRLGLTILFPHWTDRAQNRYFAVGSLRVSLAQDPCYLAY